VLHLEHEPDLRFIKIPGNKASQDWLCDLLRLLLAKEPEQRPHSIREVKQHPWFANVDWEAFSKRAYKAPMVPTDILHFKYFKEHGQHPTSRADYMLDTRFFPPK